jgi:hypothetical protein
VTASSGREAVDNANSYNAYDVGMCQKWVRGPCWEVGSYYGSAIDAWDGAKYKHPGDRTPPLGAPCYYRGGNYGHVVIFRQDDMRSTDCTSSGRVSPESLSWIENHWGYTYLGWTEDINGVHVIKPAAPEEDEMELQDKMDEWSPADGTSKEQVTVGYTLRQARGYAEDAYQRIGKLSEKVDNMQKDIDSILKKLG